MRPRAERRRSSDSIGNSSGFALAGALIFLFVLGIIGISYFAMAGYETRASQQDLDSQRAFWLAEGGRERAMKWMTDQRRPPEIYVTPIYASSSGPSGGSYTVTCLVDTAGLYSVEKAFVLECLGESGGRQRKIRQRIKMLSFAQYGYFTEKETKPGEGPIWFVDGNVIEGLIHTNGTFHIDGDPQFLGKVTSHSDHMVGAPSNNVYGPAGWPVGGNNPFFRDGFELDVDSIPLPTDAGDLRDVALSDGMYFPASMTIELGITGDFAGVVNPGWLRYQDTAAGGTNWDDRQISTIVKPVIYSEGDLRVKGVLDGEMTISAAGNILIVDDLTYLASDAAGKPLAGCNDLLGIVSGKNIIFDHNDPTTDDLKVDAVLMALGTSITAKDFSTRDLCDELTIWGGLIQRYRGAVGTHSGGVMQTGYQKDYHYDPRVTARTPPEFPLTGVYEEVAWMETWDASDPF